MLGVLKDNNILIDNQKGASRLHNRGGFGKPLPMGRLKLDPVEGTYLVETKKLKVVYDDVELSFHSLFDNLITKDPRFEHKYMVFRDLKRRGYRIQCTYNSRMKEIDFLLSPKQGRMQSLVSARAEREKFSIKSIRALCHKLCYESEQLWIAIVDEEGDITYYSVFPVEPAGRIKTEKMKKGKGVLIKNHVFVYDRENARQLLKTEFFGKPFGKNLQLSLIEAVYLKEKGLLDVEYHRRNISLKKLKTLAKQQQPDIGIRYSVYKDLKKRNLGVKTGFKFGTHFRAYEKDPHKTHAEYLVDAVEKNYTATWSMISKGVRLAHSVKKLYTLAVLDKPVEYIAFQRLRP